MLGKLAQYVVEARQQGRTLIGVEEDFSVELGEIPATVAAPADSEAATVLGDEHAGTPGHVVRLRGQVDRLEADANGNLVVVDIKRAAPNPPRIKFWSIRSWVLIKWP
ncbi:PD-(D/E)XK nuclease family protein [Arthrobacter alpinus]|nr:PD-(D/E)XK nuclease family protein [Arthrobacter alpinus]